MGRSGRWPRQYGNEGVRAAPGKRQGSNVAPQGHSKFTPAGSDSFPATPDSARVVAVKARRPESRNLIRIIFYPFVYTFTGHIGVALCSPWGVEWASFAPPGRHCSATFSRDILGSSCPQPTTCDI